LLLQPGIDVAAVVPDVSADTEAARPGSEVAPVPQRGWRDTQQLGDVGERAQFIASTVVVLRLLIHLLLRAGVGCQGLIYLGGCRPWFGHRRHCSWLMGSTSGIC
jgi:hypothetical protein